MYRHLIFTILLSLFLPAFLNAAIPTSDNWDNSLLNGWQPNTSLTIVSVVDNGGNPNGDLLSNSDPGNIHSTNGALSRESRYTGDFQTPNIGQVNVDLNLLSGSITRIYLRFRYLDATHNGWIYEITNSLPMRTWTHFEILFDPNWSDADAITAGWMQESISPSFSETMLNVYTTEVRLISSDIDNTELGIDNFAIIGDDAAIPTLNEWGMIISGCLLSLAALIIFRRREEM